MLMVIWGGTQATSTHYLQLSSILGGQTQKRPSQAASLRLPALENASKTIAGSCPAAHLWRCSRHGDEGWADGASLGVDGHAAGGHSDQGGRNVESLGLNVHANGEDGDQHLRGHRTLRRHHNHRLMQNARHCTCSQVFACIISGQSNHSMSLCHKKGNGDSECMAPA